MCHICTYHSCSVFEPVKDKIIKCVSQSDYLEELSAFIWCYVQSIFPFKVKSLTACWMYISIFSTKIKRHNVSECILLIMELFVHCNLSNTSILSHPAWWTIKADLQPGLIDESLALWHRLLQLTKTHQLPPTTVPGKSPVFLGGYGGQTPHVHQSALLIGVSIGGEGGRLQQNSGVCQHIRQGFTGKKTLEAWGTR